MPSYPVHNAAKKNSNRYPRAFPIKRKYSKPAISQFLSNSRPSVYVVARNGDRAQKNKLSTATVRTSPIPNGLRWRRSNGKDRRRADSDTCLANPQDYAECPRSRAHLDELCYDLLSESKQQQLQLQGNELPSLRAIRLTICLDNTHFSLLGKVARKMGYQAVPEHRLWNVKWTDNTPHMDLLKNMKRFQQINHFPGMSEICRKDMLSRNLNRMLKIFPGDYRIFPKTWLLPLEAYDVSIYASKHKRTFILKPYSGGRGRGIWLTNNLSAVCKRTKLICQKYIDKPLLIDGYKFDLRVYTLITSVDPLRIFVYNEGLARFATQKYVAPNMRNSKNVYMHLTNYSLNRHNSEYQRDAGNDSGIKRKLSSFNKWLLEHGYDKKQFWDSVDDGIIKTIISAWPVLRHNYHNCFPKHDKIQACFQLLGFDILVDWKLKPYILEVNHTPSLMTDETVDHDVKRPLVRDTLNILTGALVDKDQIIREDRSMQKSRFFSQISGRQAGGSSLQNKEFPEQPPKGQACSLNSLTQQIAWEESHLGNYRRIMPPTETEKVNYYCKFYDQNRHHGMFSETAASRKRDEMTRLHLKRLKEQNQLDSLVRMPQLHPQPQQRLAWEQQRRHRETKHSKFSNAEWINEYLRPIDISLVKEHLASCKSIRSDQQTKKQMEKNVKTGHRERLYGWHTVKNHSELQERYRQRKPTKRNRKSAQKNQTNVAKKGKSRRQHMLDLEAYNDAMFVAKHALFKPGEARLVAGNATVLARNFKVLKQKPKKRNQVKPQISKSSSSSTSESIKTITAEINSSNWQPVPITLIDETQYLSWRRRRTEEFASWKLQEKIFEELYKNGQLTKNDIKKFPHILYNLLTRDGVGCDSSLSTENE